MFRSLMLVMSVFAWGCDDTDADPVADARPPADMASTDMALADEGAPDSDAPDARMAQTPFEKAVEAVGGAEFLMGLQTLQIEAEGEDFIDYSAHTPGELHETNTYQVTYHFDLGADAQRHDMERTLLFGTLQFIGTQTFSLIMRGRLGVLTAPAGFAQPGAIPSQQIAARRQKQRFFNPHFLLREAVADPTRVAPGEPIDVDGRAHETLVFADAVRPIQLLVDTDTGTIAQLRTRANHPLMRDIDIEVRYLEWTASGSGRYPARIELRSDGMLVQVERRTRFDTGVTFAEDHFVYPANMDPGVVDETAYGYGQQTAVAADAFFGLITYLAEVSPFEYAPIAPGVAMLAGAANTLILEHSGGVVVIEGAASPARAEAQIDTLIERSPDRAVTHLVQSHHHYDHAAGVRSFAAVGADIVVGNGAGALWDRALQAPSTIRPDLLARTPIDLTVTEIEAGGTFTLSDERLDLVVHHLPDDEHAVDMLLPVFTVDGVTYVYVTDDYNAGLGVTIRLGGPAYFFQKLRDLELIDADCTSATPLVIIPSHGRPQSLADSIAELERLEIDVGCP